MMMRSGRLRKGLIFLLVLGFAGIALLGCARLYLKSSRASRQVADKLQTVLGVPVRIDEADIGFNSDSSLRGLQIFEANGQRPDKPWLTVNNVRTDLSALDVVGGDSSPRSITLSEAAIALRFDANGQLLTALPTIKPTGQPTPQVLLKNSRLTLAQEGRPPMVIEGLDAQIDDRDSVLTFRGTIHDAFWGNWTAAGTFNTADGQFDLKLKTQRIEVTQEKLELLPFVALSTWRQVHLHGFTPVDFELRFTLGGQGSHYKVDLVPENTEVRVTSIDLDAKQASGQVTVEDRVVKLRDVHGITADGTIQLPAADLDFRQPVSDMTFGIRVANVALSKLPKSWPIRERLGRLTGQAKLNVKVKDGKAYTTGDGEGEVDTGVLFKIKIRLTADGDKFHFLPKAEAPNPLKLLPSLKIMIRELPVNAVADNPEEKPTYLEATVSANDAPIDELLRQLEVKPPFAITGKVSFVFQAIIPLDTSDDTRAYKMQGQASAARLEVAGLEMTDLTATVKYADGVMTLDEFRGRFADSDGRLAGGGKFQLVPEGDATLTLRVEQVPLKRVLALLPGPEGKGEGSVSGHVDARVAAGRWREPLAWEASGALQSECLALYGLPLTKMRLALTVKDGTATAHDLTGELEGGRVSGHVAVRWAEGYPYQGKLELKNADLAGLQHLSANLRPAFTLEGRADFVAGFQGRLTPLSLAASGTAQAKEMSVSGVQIEALAFQWTQEANRVKVTDLAAKLYDGQVSGSATLPLDETAGGEARLQIEAVEARKLATAVPLIPVTFAGRVSGTVSGTLSAAAPGKPRELTTEFDVNAPMMQVQGVTAERLHGHVVYRGGGMEYRLDGAVLGGRFELEGKLPPPEPPDKAPEGHLHIQGVRLSQLGAALHLRDELAPLAGSVEVDLPYRHEGPERMPVGAGRFRIRNVRWAGNDLAGSIQGDIRWNGFEVSLRNISGEYGEGSLRGTLVVNAKQREQSRFHLHLEHVEASSVLLPFTTGLAPSATSAPVGGNLSPLQGPVDINLHGHLGRDWRANGEIAVTRGKLYGAEINEWHMPVSLSYSPVQGTGQLDFNENMMHLAQGRVQGRASLRWGSGLRLEGALRFFEVDLPTLLRSVGESSRFAVGRASGRLDFGGENIQSADDLTATLEASFTQAQALQLPILEGLVRYVAPGQAAMTFQKGDLRATLARGVIRVKRLSLLNATLQMLVEGTVTLTGRLDLEATASTGTLGINPNALRLLGIRLPPLGPLPLATLVQASAYLSNRVVQLRVTGTVKSPHVQINPVQLLTEEAIRFFLSEAVGVATP